MVNTIAAEPAELERVAALAELVEDTPEVVIDLETVRANITRIASDGGRGRRRASSAHEDAQAS